MNLGEGKILSYFQDLFWLRLYRAGQYPGEQGIVAPGMSCQFAVKFAPDSLTDYVDKVQVLAYAFESLLILLTLPYKEKYS